MGIFKEFYFVIFVLMLASMVGCDISSTKIQPTETSTSIPGVTSPCLTAITIPDRQAYTNQKYGYVVKYPSNWAISNDLLPYSVLFEVIRNEPTGPTFPDFYITAIPKGFTWQDAEFYNFMSDEAINKFLTIKVGETFSIDDFEPEFFTFTRLPDITIAGERGIVIENDKVWAAIDGIKDRRVLVKQNGITYILGTYYQTSRELGEFQAVNVNRKGDHRDNRKGPHPLQGKEQFTVAPSAA